MSKKVKTTRYKKETAKNANPQECGLSETIEDRSIYMPDESILYPPGCMPIGFEDGASDILDRLADVDEPTTESLHDCEEAFWSLDNYDVSFAIFDKCRGETAWLKGAILNYVKPIEPGHKGIAKRGEWRPFCKAIKISGDTSERFRHIHRRFKRIEARTLGYMEMLNTLADERRVEKEMQGNGNGAKTKKSKTPIEVAGNRAKSVVSAIEKLTEHTDRIGSRNGLKVKDHPDAIQAIATEIDLAIQQLFHQLSHIWEHAGSNPDLSEHLAGLFEAQINLLRGEIEKRKAA